MDYDATNVTITLNGTESAEQFIGISDDGICEGRSDESFMVLISIEGGTMDGRVRLGSSFINVYIEDGNVGQNGKIY